jgi:hypothetical protein
MSLNGLLNQTITLFTKSGLDKYGKETYGSSVSTKARVQVTTKTRLLPNGQTKTILAVAYVAPSTTINVGDKVTYGGIDYKVFGRYDAVDGEGETNHIKVELTKWE